MKRIVWLLAGALCGAFFVGSAQAQSFDGEVGAGHVLGNPGTAAATATDASLTAMFDQAFCTTNNAALARLAGSWVCLASASNAVWATNGSGVPALTQTLPSAVQGNITATGTLAAGATGAGFTINFATSALSGRVPFANVAQGSALSVLGVAGNATADHASIAAGVDNQVLRRSGAAVGFGAVNLASSNAVTGALPLGNGGTGQTTAAAARGSAALNIDAITIHGDSIYTIVPTDRLVATSAALTASRTWTLPAATSVNPGQMLVVADLAGGVTATNTLVISRAGSDTINGGTSVTINAANGAYYLWSDGASKWNAQAQSANPGAGTVTSATIAADASALASGTCTVTSSGTCTVSVEQTTPGGRLTLVSGGCNTSTDQVAATTLYYSPCGGEWVPVYDGTSMKLRQFTSSATDTVGLSIALTNNWGVSTLYDVFVGMNTGMLTLCTGPPWTNSGAGSSSRGTGAGTAELAIYKGLWTNKVSMTCRYSAGSTFTCGVNQCTYLGTFLSGGVAGQIDLKFGTLAAGGGAARLSICNQYNKIDTVARVGDSNASWNYISSGFRAADLAGGGQNLVTVVSCNSDIGINARYSDRANPVAAGAFTQLGVGLDATTPHANSVQTINQAGGGMTQTASLDMILAAGRHDIYALEASDNTNANTFFGNNGTQSMLLTVSTRM